MLPALHSQIHHWLLNPDTALLLLASGILLIYVECNRPGSILPGALGTLLTLTSFYALTLHPIHPIAVALLAASAILLLLEARYTLHNLLTAAGTATLAIGLSTLTTNINPYLATGISLILGPITVYLARLALRARISKFRLGIDALIGSPAEAIEPLTPQGRILVEGEIWQAVAEEPIPAGTRLQVTGHTGNLLKVTR